MDFEKLITVLPKDPIKWDQNDIKQWLEFINLQEFYPKFQQCAVDGSILASLTDNDLQQELQIESKIMRKKILTWVNYGFSQYSKYFQESQQLQQQNNSKAQQIDFQNFHKKILEQSGILQPQLDGNIIQQSPNKILSSNNSSAKKMDIQIQQENNYQQKLQLPQKQHSQENQALDYLESDIGNLNIEKQNNLLFQKKQSQQNEIQIENENQSNDSFDIEQIKEDMKKNKLLKKSNIPDIKQNNLQQQFEQIDIPSHQQQQQQFQKQQNPLKQQQLQQQKSQQLDNDQLYDLIIEPCETQQQQWYCIKQQGLKIGRHSKNELLLLEESISRFHAEIIYNQDQKVYQLQDLGSTTGTFIRIENQIELFVDMIFEVGSCQFQVTHIDQTQITLLIIEGPRDGEQFILDFNENNQYRIGRKSSNFIFIEDAHLSQVHSEILFQNNKFILKDKKSTNGTWYRLSQEGEKSEPHTLQNNDKFKIGISSTFQCQYQQQQINNNNLNAQDQCKICYENPIDSVILPCKHSLTCLACTKNQKVCPVCRSEIEDVVRMYMK